MSFLLGFVLFQVHQKLLIFNYFQGGSGTPPNYSRSSSSETLLNIVWSRLRGVVRLTGSTGMIGRAGYTWTS